MPPAGPAGAAPLAAVVLLVLGAPLALTSEDCLWYLDRNGSWHPGFDCEFFTFCCGTCYQRYCCRDLTLLITERQQKHCLAFSPKTIAGIASAVILFVCVVATTICCFLCSCCYLYRRRQQLQSPFEGQEIPMTGIPMQQVYQYPRTPKAAPVPPQPGFMYPPSGPAPQYPLYPAGPPIYNPAAPPPICHHSPLTQEPEETAVSSMMPFFGRFPILYLHPALGVGMGLLVTRPQIKPSPGPCWDRAPEKWNVS